MNPFVHSTVARHLPLAQWRGPRRARTPGGPRAARLALRRAIGALLLTAGLGVAAPPAHAVDINQATAAQLESVRGIGPRTAEIIVRERERGGSFESLEDLSERVRGIGQKKAQALQAAGLTIGGAAAPEAGASTASRPAPGKPAAGKPAASGGSASSARPAAPGASATPAASAPARARP